MNKKIAGYFLTDARDFLKRFKLLEENSTHLGLRSKLLTDLIFSAECALKSLIFIESETDEKSTYKKVKDLGHKISKLLDSLEPQSQKEFKKIMKIDLSNIEIYNRYQIESEIDFREYNGALGQKYYNTIADFNWMNTIYQQVNNFIDYVDKKNPISLTSVNFIEIDPQKEIDEHIRLRNIRQKNTKRFKSKLG